jgi:hypothetical protein
MNGLVRWLNPSLPEGLALKPDLAKIPLGAGSDIIHLIADIPEGLVGFYSHLPVAGIDGVEVVFPIDIQHLDRILSLDRPYPIGAPCWEYSDVEGRSLQQPYGVYAGYTNNYKT